MIISFAIGTPWVYSSTFLQVVRIIQLLNYYMLSTYINIFTFGNKEDIKRTEVWSLFYGCLKILSLN